MKPKENDYRIVAFTSEFRESGREGNSGGSNEADLLKYTGEIHHASRWLWRSSGFSWLAKLLAGYVIKCSLEQLGFDLGCQIYKFRYSKMH
jgi:hypothetical protein